MFDEAFKKIADLEARVESLEGTLNPTTRQTTENGDVVIIIRDGDKPRPALASVSALVGVLRTHGYEVSKPEPEPEAQEEPEPEEPALS